MSTKFTKSFTDHHYPYLFVSIYLVVCVYVFLLRLSIIVTPLDPLPYTVTWMYEC